MSMQQRRRPPHFLFELASSPPPVLPVSFLRPGINPTGALPVLDPEDSYLLSNPDPVQAHPSALSHANSLVDNGSSAPGTPSGGHIDVNSHVSWLRKTEYIQKDAVRAGGGGLKGLVHGAGQGEEREGREVASSPFIVLVSSLSPVQL